MGHAEQPDFDDLLLYATRGLEQATDEGNDPLRLSFYRFLLGLPPTPLRRNRIDVAELRLQQGVTEKLSASWADAMETLRCAETEFAAREPSESVLLKRLACRADIVNAQVTLMQTDDALAEVEEALRLIQEHAGSDIHGELAHARDRLWHRRAVALWFDGNIREAVQWQRRAYSSGRRQRDPSTVSTTLREMGTLMLHRNPRLGHRLLSRALEILMDSGERHHEPALLIRVEILLAELLIAHWLDEDRSRLSDLLECAAQLHFQCRERASLYEAPLAALIAGAASALLGNLSDSHHWFKLATTTAMQARANDEIWKSRLNLAQVCLDLGAHGEARIHAREAARILEVGLTDGRWERRAGRRVFLFWPLSQCIRVYPDLAQDLGKYLREIGPSRRWSLRPRSVTRADEDPQVLHVRNGDSDYYVIE